MFVFSKVLLLSVISLTSVSCAPIASADVSIPSRVVAGQIETTLPESASQSQSEKKIESESRPELEYETSGHKRVYRSYYRSMDSDLVNKIMSVFAPNEVEIIKSDQPIGSTPLAIERRLGDLWKLGYEESKIETPEKFRTISKLVEKIKQNPQLARQHTGLSRFLSAFYKKHATGQEPNIKDFIQAFNSNNTFVIDPQTMCQQIQWAYQLGSLHSLNQHVGTKYAMRSFQKATPAEVQTMIEKQKRQTQKHEFETADMAAVDSETLEGDAINDIVYSQIAA